MIRLSLPIQILQEGLTTVEKRTVNLIQETRKQIRKKPSSSDAHNQTQQQRLADLELQLKASRDVRWQLCIGS